MHAAPQMIVNRAPTPVLRRASTPVTTRAGAGGMMQSPYATRFAGSISQREPSLGRSGVPSGASSDGGKRMYRTGEGSLVELPPDMTAEQAACLESDAKAAQKQLGKGPAPLPVPDVKKLAKKDARVDQGKPRAKGKRHGRSRGQVAPQIGGAATALFAAVGKGNVAQYLAARGAPALAKGIGLLQKLRKNEQTHDDATEKRQQSERAVVIPPSDGQAKSNAGQVHSVGDRPAPAVDEKIAKGKLQETLAANTPQSIEDVDNFQRDKKAQHMGADVMLVVQGDKNAVTSTFGDLEQTPPPAPPEHQPESLPPEEVAPSTPVLNLGQGTIAPLQKEHTDTSNYTREADGKLKEEGVTQEQLEMVDNGDLAEANKEKKGLEKAAQTEPIAVQDFARQESETVDRELKQEEKKDRDSLRAKRKSGLNATAQKQHGAKSALEKKRDEVASKINGIYKTAQDKVKKRLADLETQSMKRFDDGNSLATKAFEDNVKRELEAFKSERYSGWFGWARRAKDWLLGMDELPEVKAIFDRNRAAFVRAISTLVDDISADNQRVIQECKDELARAKKAIQEYVDQLEPSLKGIGNKAAEEMNAKLNELDQFISKKEAELQTKLKDKQTAAIKAVDQKIEKMKEAMSGALAKLGKLLLLAAKKFFKWALQKFGYSLEEIEGIISKGAAVLKAIFTKPAQFVRNLINAASTGFQNFAKNFLKHLKDAIFDWLTGSLEGIQLPSSWDLKGIASVAFQMLGLTWANIRGKLVKLIGETPVKAMETGFDLVVTLVREGPMAAWEKIKEMADDIKTTFVEAVQDFIKIKVVQRAIETILSLFIPGAGILRAIVGIYDTVVFFIQKAKQIAQMVGNFLSSVGEIAMGNIGAAADALEKGLATALKLVINFLAKFLRLDGLTAKIRLAIQKLRTKVDGMLDKLVAWIVAKAKQLIRKGVGVVKAGVGSVVQWWRDRRQFKAGTESHSLYFEGEWPHANLFIESQKHSIRAYYEHLKSKKHKATRKEMKAILGAITIIEQINATSGGNFTIKDGNAIKLALDTIVKAIKDLTGETIPPTRVDWKSKKAAGSQVGKRMIASVLSINPGGHSGSEPHQTTAFWDAVNQRPRSYVLGHLLNHHLHGKGERENLVPISFKTNSKMSARVEEKVKDAVFKDREAVYYEVNVVFGQQPKRRIPEEQLLPTKLEFTAYSLESDWKTKKDDLSIPTSITHELPPDDPIGRPRVVINLNRLPRKREDAKTKLDSIPQIGPNIADRIITAVNTIRARGDAVHRYSQLSAEDSQIPSNVLTQLETDDWLTLYPH